jgi:PAS domain S-box-containing protein
MGFFEHLFSTDGFMPHVHCYLMRPGMVWTMFTSDMLIGIAYAFISFKLYSMVRKIKLPFSGMFLAFGIFIAACGATHFMEVITLWEPVYWVAASVKILTAIASVATAAYMIPIQPKVMEIAQASKAAEKSRQLLQYQTDVLAMTSSQLEESKESFSLLVSGIKDYAIYMLDGEGRVISWNEGAQRIKGYETADILSKHFSIFYLPEDVASGKPQYELQQAIAYGRYEDEGWRIRKDGTKFWAGITISTLYDEDGSLRGFVKLTRDITEKKKAEDKLHWAYTNLEKRVQERTAELAELNNSLQKEIKEREAAQRALALKAKELARSNSDLEQFASAASHDLKAPLRAVSMHLELLIQRCGQRLSEAEMENVQFAISGARQMNDLVEYLLQYSRAGGGSLSLESVDLNKTVQKALFNLKAEIENSKARIIYSNLPNLYADTTSLLQVFQNLISNAIKYRRETPEIKISAEELEDSWVISVKDNGIGISSENFERIFTIFQRLHTDEEYPGAGIGLAICKKIIERHNGKIWIESKPGFGTTFFISLPKSSQSTFAANG